MIVPIKIYKNALQDKKWNIQWDANRWDNPHRRNGVSRPYIVGYCPSCDAQRHLSYIGQTKEDFVFECTYCLENSDKC